MENYTINAYIQEDLIKVAEAILILAFVNLQP